ncbi:GspE/PulE family protein [Syntrophothermus sp.]|uniref:GspE/PulE family protein n=1 Tax=Syntrophothermus sp. TaxID=2736299 RepID=UPI00257A47D9|nr:GspE/PulE family protein [Syntrophothermus sp.]
MFRMNQESRGRPRLGELLLQAGAITEDQLQQALKLQKEAGPGQRLGDILVKNGFVTEAELARALEEQLGIRSIDLKIAPIDVEVARRIPENLARRHTAIPVQVVDGALIVAMKDPLDMLAVQDIRLVTGMPVTPLLASEKDILDTIENVFSQRRAAEQAARDASRMQEEAAAQAAAALDIESAPAVRLVNSLIENAVRSRASDIHIEPSEKRMRVRNRVDGVLHEVLSTDIRAHAPVVSRIKVMAGLNIAEKRIPQDGKIVTRVDGRPVDLRVATMPTAYGEKVAIRILDRASFFIDKSQLGLSPEDIEKFNRLVSRPWGIILVTGPTGSGKTTTLYAMLAEMDSERKNIATLEDPIEYDMEGISQTQINVQAGLTFASGLRTMLRQDPDIIMVGEIRDEETAEIAARAALTGHLVLSTLHTNDAASTVIRLMDMGLMPYLIASSLAGVIAQRLVRKVCPDCREKYDAGPEEKRILGMPEDEALLLVRSGGCVACRGTGYRGRTGVFEIMEVDGELRKLINRGVSADEVREAALLKGMVPLWEDCRRKVLEGITTLEEALRVTSSY